MPEEAAEKDKQADLDRIYAPDALPYVQAQERIIRLDETERRMCTIGIPKPLILQAGDIVIDHPDDPDAPARADEQFRRLAETAPLPLPSVPD